MNVPSEGGYVTFSFAVAMESTQLRTGYQTQSNFERCDYLQETLIEMDSKVLINIAVDIASGMEYLSRLRVKYKIILCIT